MKARAEVGRYHRANQYVIDVLFLCCVAMRRRSCVRSRTRLLRLRVASRPANRLFVGDG